jgi:hypothetical protein
MSHVCITETRTLKKKTSQSCGTEASALEKKTLHAHVCI